MRTVAALLFVLFSLAAPAEEIPELDAALAREVLPANDGWAAAGAGTTGGSAAIVLHAAGPM